MRKTRYTKSMLVRELAFSTGITQKTAGFVLEALCHIAYREAGDQGFTLPGLCRMDVIRRKARKMKNPQTGETILIAEHDALRVRPLKKARDAITPARDDLVTVLGDNAATTPPAPDTAILDDFSKAVSFRCKACGQEIEAPLAAVGIQAECPVCGKSITIPATSEPGTLHGPPPDVPSGVENPPFTPQPQPDTEVAPTRDAAPLPPPSATASETGTPSVSIPDATKLKNQTIRIDLSALGLETPGTSVPKTAATKRMLSFFCKNCRQEIEAPAEMAGSAAECPSCGLSFEVPFFSDPGTLHGSDLDQKKDADAIQSMKSRTIRIEVPDDF